MFIVPLLGFSTLFEREAPPMDAMVHLSRTVAVMLPIIFVLLLVFQSHTHTDPTNRDPIPADHAYTDTHAVPTYTDHTAQEAAESGESRLKGVRLHVLYWSSAIIAAAGVIAIVFCTKSLLGSLGDEEYLGSMNRDFIGLFAIPLAINLLKASHTTVVSLQKQVCWPHSHRTSVTVPVSLSRYSNHRAIPHCI
jgi:Ca2+/H+ antiporter